MPSPLKSPTPNALIPSTGSTLGISGAANVPSPLPRDTAMPPRGAETMSGKPSPLKSATAINGGASAEPVFSFGIGTFRKPGLPLDGPSVAVPGKENPLPVATFVPEKETVPEGGTIPLVPTFAVNAYVPYVFVATGPEIEATV